MTLRFGSRQLRTWGINVTQKGLDWAELYNRVDVLVQLREWEDEDLRELLHEFFEWETEDERPIQRRRFN
jgi:hypothetical protein